MEVSVQIGETVFQVVLETKEAAKMLVGILQHAPLTLQMSEHGGFEKVGAIGRRLPADDVRMTTQTGDLVLYNSDQLVLFYGSNTWSYTKIGHIKDLSGWKEALGNGDITIILSLEG